MPSAMVCWHFAHRRVNQAVVMGNDVSGKVPGFELTGGKAASDRHVVQHRCETVEQVTLRAVLGQVAGLRFAQPGDVLRVEFAAADNRSEERRGGTGWR